MPPRLPAILFILFAATAFPVVAGPRVESLGPLTGDVANDGGFGLKLPPPPPVSAHPLDSLSAALPDAEWMAKAGVLSRHALSRADVDLVQSVATTDRITFRFRVNRYPETRVANIPLVIPDGKVTSVTVAAIERGGVEMPGTGIETITADLDVLGYVRNYRIGRVRINLGEPLSGGARVSGGVVHLLFDVETAPQAPASGAFSAANSVGPIRRALDRFVANPGDLNRFMIPSASSVPEGLEGAGDVPVSVLRSPFRMKIPILESGLYRISGADLESSGVVVSWLKPEHLHLLVDGHEEPMLFMPKDGLRAATMRVDDAFLFYGRTSESPYSERNNYWLVYDTETLRTEMPGASPPGPEQQCESASVFAKHLVVEQDNNVLTRNDQFLSILGFHWVWQELNAGKPAAFEFNAPGIAGVSSALPATLNLYLHSYPQGRSLKVRLSLNDGDPVEFPIVSENDTRKPFMVPPRVLKPTRNRAVVELVDEATTPVAGMPEQRNGKLEVFLDNLELWYPQVFTALGGQLEFSSPSRELSIPDAATSVPRGVEYRIGGVAPRVLPVVLDITDAQSFSIPIDVRPPTRPNESATVQFKVLESGAHKYLLSSVEAALSAPLVPAPAGVDLRSQKNRADYVIISHPDFIETMQSFADARTAEGHAAIIVNVNDIYDQFAFGQETPEAIKRFLCHASRNWEGSGVAPACTFVLLVGDATSAYRNQFRNGVVNYVPSYTMSTFPGGSERWASDHWYSTLFGTDDLADTLIGRLSVNNTGDLKAILAKNSAYRKLPTGVPWANTLGYVADHTEFDDAVETVAGSVPPSFSVKRISLSSEPWVDNFYYPKELADAKRAKVSPETTRKIRDMINDGTAMLTYFGHGSPNIWSTERIWFGGDSENSDNLMLKNAERLPVILNMTCNSGAIDYPMPRWNVCISEDIMRVPDGGAVACYVPSGPGVTSLHEKFTLALNRALLAEQVRPLGAALARGSWRYLLDRNPPELARMFILLGDPGIELPFLPVGVVPEAAPASVSALKVISWSLSPTGLLLEGENVRFVAELENTSRQPIRAARFRLVADSGATVESEPFSFLPHETRNIPLMVGLNGGVHFYRMVADGRNGGQTELELKPRAVTTASRVKGEGDNALIDRGSIAVRYSNEAGLTVVTATFDVWNAASSPLDNLTAAWGSTDGIALADSITSLPGILPGTKTSVQLRREYVEVPESEELILLVDQPGPSGTRESTGPVVLLGKAGMPDLAIIPAGIVPSKTNPVDGETVFFDVEVENRGGAVALGVRVDGYDGLTTASPRLESRIAPRYHELNLEPGSTTSVRLRWDPFRNAGERPLCFRAWSGVSSVESDLTNNEQVISLKVLTKQRLRPAGIAVIPPTKEEVLRREIRIAVRVKNEGESPAHGVKVIVYPTHDRGNPKDALGETLIEEILPNATAQAVIHYKLKPGEEKRVFEPSFEAFLKGSLQRVPWPD
jgi:hypothetical protein